MESTCFEIFAMVGSTSGIEMYFSMLFVGICSMVIPFMLCLAFDMAQDPDCYDVMEDECIVAEMALDEGLMILFDTESWCSSSIKLHTWWDVERWTTNYDDKVSLAV